MFCLIKSRHNENEKSDESLRQKKSFSNENHPSLSSKVFLKFLGKEQRFLDIRVLGDSNYDQSKSFLK